MRYERDIPGIISICLVSMCLCHDSLTMPVMIASIVIGIPENIAPTPPNAQFGSVCER